MASQNTANFFLQAALSGVGACDIARSHYVKNF